MEDGEATELVQNGIIVSENQYAYDALGGRTTQSTENLIDEAAIRALWQGYRRLMCF
jgi:anthranilate 1,2-dioxygenase large subunit